MRTLIFLQARMGSKRLPGKVLFNLVGKSVIGVTVERLNRVQGSDGIVLLTGPVERNQALIDEAKKIGLSYFSGAEENLIDRFYQASKELKPSIIIRVTADCPLIDPHSIAQGLAEFKEGAHEFIFSGPTCPAGLEYEIFNASVLQRAWETKRNLYLTEEKFKSAATKITESIQTVPNIRTKKISHDSNINGQRWTLDYPEDYEVISKIYDALYPLNPNFGFKDIVSFMKNNPHLIEMNRKYINTP